MRTAERGEAGSQVLVIGHPGAPPLLMRLHRKPRPLLELLVHQLAGCERVQAEGMAAKVDQRLTARIARQREARPKTAERIARIARPCGRQGVSGAHAARSSSA